MHTIVARSTCLSFLSLSLTLSLTTLFFFFFFSFLNSSIRTCAHLRTT